MDILGVYSVDFGSNCGAEINGIRYAVVMSERNKKDGTFLVAPLTSKKSGVKYKGGITIVMKDYLLNPTYEKSFIKVRKMKEIDRKRIRGPKRFDLNEVDKAKLIECMKDVFTFIKNTVMVTNIIQENEETTITIVEELKGTEETA